MKPSGTVKQGRRPMFQAFIPATIAIGHVDGELVDENGFYISAAETKAEIVRRYNCHAELLEALKALRNHMSTLEELGVNIGIRDEGDQAIWMDQAEDAIAKAEGRP